MGGERWATFDCYGTLIDWMAGIRDTLADLWPDHDAMQLLARYHEIEPEVQEGRSVSYRQVLSEALTLLGERDGLFLAEQDRSALADALPTWPPFAEVPGSLREVRARGWRIALLSNTDHDLLDASLSLIGVEVDLRITAEEASSYKPAHGHWERFREKTGAAPPNHVHVAASLFHDIEPCLELGIPAIWINRLGEVSDLPRAAELPDLSRLPETLDAVTAG